MRIVYPLLAFWLGLTCLAFAAPAAKNDKPKSDPGVPAGSKGTIALTYKDLNDNLQMLEARKYGIVARFILPKGWKVNEEGKDPKTGKVREDMGLYVLTSQRPMPDPKDPTDFIFELDLFAQPISKGIPAGTSKEKYQEEFYKSFMAFLNTQISMNQKSGNKLTTAPKNIEPKEYGPDSRGKKSVFFPIFYEVPPPVGDKTSKGAMLYTFSGFEGDTAYVLKFLVSKDMVDQHGGLIALVLDNSWAVTEAVDKALQEGAKAEAAEGAAASKNKSKNN